MGQRLEVNNMSIKQKIGAGLAIGSMVAGVLAPASAFAATNINVKNNGFGSFNHVWSFKYDKKKVKQKNKTRVNSFVSSYSNTGGNHSSFNTGGTNTINSGSTTTGVAIGVTGNSNVNEDSQGCCCDGGDTTIQISGNSAFSHNGVGVFEGCKDVVKQGNKTSVNTTVITSSKTGHNSSSFNTGGNNSVESGDTTTSVVISVEGGTNTNN